MSFTNKTPNYNLPQYVAADKPTYLTDFNGAMSAIDTGMHNNEQAISNANDDIATVKNDITSIKKNITTMQNWQTNIGPIVIDSAQGLVQIARIDRNITLASAGTAYEFTSAITLTDYFDSIYGITSRLTFYIEIFETIGILTTHYYLTIPGANIGTTYNNFIEHFNLFGLNGNEPIGGSIYVDLLKIGTTVGAVTSSLSNPHDVTFGFYATVIRTVEDKETAYTGLLSELKGSPSIRIGRILAKL